MTIVDWNFRPLISISDRFSILRRRIGKFHHSMIVILILKFESAMQLLFTPYLEVLGLCLKTYLLLKIAKIQRIILIFVILLEMKTSSIQNVEIAFLKK